MNVAKFTPGPWTVDKSHMYGAINAGKWHVAMANFYNCHDEEVRVTREQQEANAQLISAAPDLFEALKIILEYPYGDASPLDDPLVMERARAAIRKAEGEE